MGGKIGEGNMDEPGLVLHNFFVYGILNKIEA